jgi:hypothetical protein
MCRSELVSFDDSSKIGKTKDRIDRHSKPVAQKSAKALRSRSLKRCKRPRAQSRFYRGSGKLDVRTPASPPFERQKLLTLSCVPRVTAGSSPEILFVDGCRRAKEARVDRVSVSKCAQCGDGMIAPEWSEHVSDHCVRNFWSCETCGYRFEDTIYFCAPELAVGN